MSFKYRVVAAPLLLSTALLTSHQALAQDTIIIDDFVVSANRTPVEASKTGSSVTVVTGEELARSGARLIGDYIARLPGVSMTQQGPRGSLTNVRIRGLRGQYLKVIVDGVEISDPTQPQTTADFANIPVGDVARLEVLRGPQSSLYGGDAAAGVISITTRRAERDGVSHRYNIEAGTRMTLQGDYSVSAAGEAGNLTVSAQGIHTNGFSAADERNGNAESDGLRFGAFSANGELNAGENIVFFGGMRYSSARVQYDNSFPIQDASFYQDTRSFAGRLGARWQMMDGRLENQVSLQYFSIVRENFDAFPRVSDGERYKADYLGQYRFTDRFSIMFGGDAEMTRSVENNATREARVYGGFVQALAEPIDNLSLSLNGRLDGHSTFGTFTTYRASAAYTLAPTMTTFRASYGTGFRTPSLFELFSTSGNRNLRPEQSKGFDAGVSQALFGGRFVVGATYFNNKVDNLIDFIWPQGYVQSTSRVNTSGVELEASITPFDWLSLAANYTYTEVKSADNNSRLRVPDHTVNFTATVRPVDKLEVSVNGQYAEGAREPITQRLDPYFIMGASLSYEIRENTTLYARAENIFDRRYQTVRGYGAQPRMLYVGVRGSF